MGDMPSSLGISCTVIGLRKMSLVMDRTPTTVPTSLGGEWNHRKMVFEVQSTRLEKRCRVSIHGWSITKRWPGEKRERGFQTSKTKYFVEYPRKRQWKSGHVEKNRSVEDPHSSGGMDLVASRTLEAPQPRSPVSEEMLSGKVSKMNVKQFSQDVSFDAQLDKTLSKRFVTMQTTIGNKQVKVYG